VGAAGALGDLAAGEFDVDAAEVSAECAVHLEESGGLVLHVVDVAVLWPLAASTVLRAAVYLAQRPWFFTASAATAAAAGSR
jgi:hypothetical protein